jgi:hypothetical protein
LKLIDYQVGIKDFYDRELKALKSAIAFGSIETVRLYIDSFDQISALLSLLMMKDVARPLKTVGKTERADRETIERALPGIAKLFGLDSRTFRLEGEKVLIVRNVKPVLKDSLKEIFEDLGYPLHPS